MRIEPDQVGRVRQTIRRGLLWFCAVVLGGIVVGPVISEFFVKWAEQEGVYDKPSERVGRAMSGMWGLLSSPWSVGLLCFTAGIWLDWWLRRLATPVADQKPVPQTALSPVVAAQAASTPKQSVLLQNIHSKDDLQFRERQLQLFKDDFEPIASKIRDEATKILRQIAAESHQAPVSPWAARWQATWNRDIRNLEKRCTEFFGESVNLLVKLQNDEWNPRSRVPGDEAVKPDSPREHDYRVFWHSQRRVDQSLRRIEDQMSGELAQIRRKIIEFK